MRRKVIRKIAVNPKTFTTLNETSNSTRRTSVHRKPVKRVNVTPPKVTSAPRPANQPMYTITEALYESNETFSNTIRTNAQKKIFFKCLQAFCKNKFNEASKSGKPIINMVFHGHWGWVFSNIVKEYKKYSDGFEIVCSVHPIPGASVYQYWRPVSKFGESQYNRIADPNHPFWVKGIHMMHDSPYDPSRSRTPVRLLTLGRVKHALCTSLEQKNYFDGVVNDTKCWYVPLGTNEKLKPKGLQETKGKIKLGFIGRLYHDKVKGEDMLLKIAERLDPNRFEFVILSPNAHSLVSQLKRKFKVYTNNDDSFEKLFNKIDVTLILSSYEGTPLPLIESLQIGIYVLSTKVGEAPSLLPQRNILKSSDDFVIELNKIYENRRGLEKFKKNGPELVKNRTWKSFVEKSIEIWENIL